MSQNTCSTPAKHGVVGSTITHGTHVGGRRGFPPFKQSARESAGQLNTRAERINNEKHVQQLTTASPNKKVGCLLTRSVVATYFLITYLLLNSRYPTRKRHVWTAARRRLIKQTVIENPQTPLKQKPSRWSAITWQVIITHSLRRSRESRPSRRLFCRYRMKLSSLRLLGVSPWDNCRPSRVKRHTARRASRADYSSESVMPTVDTQVAIEACALLSCWRQITLLDEKANGDELLAM